MPECLIGYTGFIGQTLLRQAEFSHRYNSTNISEIQGRHFDLVVCAGARALKWYANQNPNEDLRNIQNLMDNLTAVSADRFALISTVDVYPAPLGVDEEAPIDPARAEPYGRHRFMLEEFVRATFPRHLVLRLPGVFGPGLKKNFIFDLMHGNRLDLTHYESVFQFYNVERLWMHLQMAIGAGLTLLNLAVEPVGAKEVAERCFGMLFENRTDKPPVRYDMHTKYSKLFGCGDGYIASKESVITEIADFVRREKGIGIEAGHFQPRLETM